MLSVSSPALYGTHLNTSVRESVANLNCIPAVWCFVDLTLALTLAVTFVGSRS